MQLVCDDLPASSCSLSVFLFERPGMVALVFGCLSGNVLPIPERRIAVARRARSVSDAAGVELSYV